MTEPIAVNELHTLIVGLVALGVGAAITYRIPGVKRLGMPISVTGGVLVSLLVMLLRSTTGLEIDFGVETRDALLLVFFTTVGLSAKLSSLKAGGKPLAIVCGVTVALLVAQNLVGVGIALLRGAHPFYGLLIGSLSFVGGPGTAIAWATEGKAMGLPLTNEIALGSATLATLAGSIVAPLLTGWLIRRRDLKSTAGTTELPLRIEAEAPDDGEDPFRLKHISVSLLVILLAVAIGDWLNDWARSHDFLLPGFLTAMIAGVLITNISGLFGRSRSLAPIERGGALALQLFLVLSLMSLQIWVVAPVLGPLMLNVALQVVISACIGLIVLFRLLGRDYDAAVTAGGFVGFGLASMPVAFATMDEVSSRHGPSAKAFLIITLAGSFFVDLANATVTKAFMLLPIFD